MNTHYDEILTSLLKDEGGYTNHPADPGGPTNFGITIHDARMYLNHELSATPPWTEADLRFMKEMKLSDAKHIYQYKYWLPLKADKLPLGLDYSVFDFGVNSGISRSARYLQHMVDCPEDGIIGPHTLHAISEYDLRKLIIDFNTQRQAYLRSLPTFSTFGKGWTKRVKGVMDTSLRMAGL